MRSHRPSCALILTFGLVAGLAPRGAAAQSGPGGDIDLQAFRPAMDSRGYITVNASQVLGPREVSFGLVTNWGKGLLRFEDGENVYEVRHMVTPTLTGAIGLRPLGLELELGASLPFAIMSGDRDPDLDHPDPNLRLNYHFEGQGIGDAGLHLKWRLLDTSSAPLGLAIVGSAYLPTATREQSWIGGDSVVPQAMMVADQEVGRVRFALEGGFRYAERTAFRDDQAEMMNGAEPPLTGETIAVGSSIPFGGAISYGVVPQQFEAVAELFGAVPLEGENYFPLEASLGVKLYLAKNSFLTLGAGTGVLRGRGANPDARAFLGIVFEPNVGDRDGDGLKDDVDQCPDDPEDFDGFEDQDGCPDPDNDRDGILDTDDACPNEPEDRDGFEDEDGCPEANQLDRDGDGIVDDEDACPDDPEDIDGFEDEDGCPDPDNDGDGILDIDDLCPNDPEDADDFEDRDGCPDPDNDRDRILDVDDACPRIDGQRAEETQETYNGYRDEDGCPDRCPPDSSDCIRVNDDSFVLKEIYFEFDSAVIKEQSHDLLRTLAKQFQVHGDLELIEVQGHTDERGSDEYNLDLSQRRAQSVVDFLVAEGVERGRLEPRGYGESEPVDPRHNEEAWAENRRVEFVILERKGD